MGTQCTYWIGSLSFFALSLFWTEWCRIRGDIVALVALVAAFAVISMSWCWTFGEVPELDGSDIHQFLAELEAGSEISNEAFKQYKSVSIIDVRTEGEYSGGHIKGAVSCSLVPPWSLRGRLEAMELSKDSSHLNLMICLSAHRSIAAVRLMKEMGYENVFQLKAGMQSWRAKGLPEV